MSPGKPKCAPNSARISRSRGGEPRKAEPLVKMTWRKKTQKTMSPNKEKTSLKRHRNVALNDNSPQVHFQGLYSVLRVSKERRVGGGRMEIKIF